MSIYSTVNMKRTKAKKFIMDKLDYIDDEMLGGIMDVLLEKQMYNCSIVSDDFEGETYGG